MTARDLKSTELNDSALLLPGAELLEAIPIPLGAVTIGQDRPHAGDLTLEGDNAIYRARADGTRIQGVLGALHGLAILRYGERHVRVSRLLEARFDEKGMAGDLPSLEPSDLGCLVSFASGRACGVLVAGADRVGYAVPIQDALAHLKLTLALLPKVISDVEIGLALGLDAMRSEIGRSAALELDLGEPPTEMAA